MEILLKIVENFRNLIKLYLRYFIRTKILIYENNVKFLWCLFCKIRIEKNIVSNLMLQELKSR